SLMPFFSPGETVARHNLLRGIRPRRQKRAKPVRAPRIDVAQPGTPAQGPAQNPNPADERHIQPFRPASDADLLAAQSLIAPRLSRSNFSRVVGMDALKKQLREAADDIRSGWDAAGGGMERKNGILLHGEPGNGKSFIAEALAGELGLVFFKLTLGDVSSRWINQTTEQLLAVFRQARETPNSMLFIDEIDALLPDRNTSNVS
ncbi:ATPase, AAA-type, core domain protein, partial [mine drainage metagenome]